MQEPVLTRPSWIIAVEDGKRLVQLPSPVTPKERDQVQHEFR